MIESLYKTFKKWCEHGSIYIISDTHFDDDDCKYMDPNWITPQEHMKILKDDIKKNDTLIHLGDVGRADYLDELKCYKVLITGNHDVLSKVASHFDEVYTGPLFIADRILLSHEPIEGLEDFCCNIHGHDHEGIFRHNHINLASNVCKYRVFNLGARIKGGLLSQIENYHRRTIEKAVAIGTKKPKESKLVFSPPKDIELFISDDTKLINNSCKNCANNPSNGGNGICNCTLGIFATTY